MRTIRKGREPAFLAGVRATPSASYDALSGDQKRSVREHLAAEQHRICAYCMLRIDPGATDVQGRPMMRVEHWAAQSRSPDRDLAWTNLLGSCDGGGDGAPPTAQSCDRAKADATIGLHPAACEPGLPERTLRYLGDGTIDAEGPMDQDLRTLNLNVPRLTRARRELLDVLLARTRDLDPAGLRRVRAAWAVPTSDGLRQLVQVALYWLDKRIRAEEARRDGMKRPR